MTNLQLTSCRILRALAVGILFITTTAQAGWTAKLDGDVRFYQTTELGVLVVGTDKSLYAVDASNGDVLWRRKARNLDDCLLYTSDAADE